MWGKQMKKSVAALLTVVITLALIMSAGCGSKAELTPSGAPSSSSDIAAPADSPNGTESAKPPVEPTSGGVLPVEASGEADTEPSADHSAEPSTAPSSKPSPGPAEDDGKDYTALGWALLENDGLGLITLRLDESELLHLLGEPEEKSDVEIWGADGLEHSSWSYASKGLEIGMAKQPDDTAPYLFSITATAPCTLATSRGISIGSSKDDVLKAYMDEIDPVANEDMDSWITVGSVYGGLGFAIEDGAVTYIFIGASAE